VLQRPIAGGVRRSVYEFKAAYHVARVVVEVDVELEPVVSPGTELHLADLHVEGEVSDVDRARGTEDGRRNPRHSAAGADDRHGVAMLLESRVRTGQSMHPSVM